MNKLKREDLSDRSFVFTNKNEDKKERASENSNKEVKESKEEQGSDEDVQLRKRPYKSLMRNRKAGIPATTNSSPTNATSQPLPQAEPTGRSKSFQLLRPSSRQPQFGFGSNVFSRKSSKNQRKFSAPLGLILSRSQQRKR